MKMNLTTCANMTYFYRHEKCLWYYSHKELFWVLISIAILEEEQQQLDAHYAPCKCKPGLNPRPPRRYFAPLRLASARARGRAPAELTSRSAGTAPPSGTRGFLVLRLVIKAPM